MVQSIKATADAVLDKAVNSTPGVPGVVAVATDRNANIYEGAFGVRQAGAHTAMTTDSIFAIFSTTKAITGTACLQLVEDGKLDLDAPAKTYAPEIGKLQVLDGFDDAGKPKLRAPKRDISTRMLLLHTAGFGYDFFNENYNRLAQNFGQPSVVTASHASIRTPLLFDPGEQWEYGSNLDWAGQVVEGIAGKRLGEVMKERIFKPLGMEDTAFSMNDSMRKRMVTMHQRDDKGQLTPLPDFTLPPEPEVQMGGHGLYSTVLDYAKFIRMWLNDGQGTGDVFSKKTRSRWRPRTVSLAT
jgi:methyl acetate hydrolase